MENYLPYKSVVLFIACGAMVFAIVFIFAKRQITRFALKSNRVPHAAIGANAPKSMKMEIERRLKRVGDISYQPSLLSPFVTSNEDSENCHFYFRMKAVDSLKIFDQELQKLFPNVKRKAGELLRTFLLENRQNENRCLHGIKIEILNKFAEVYEHARHGPEDFKEENYQEFKDLLNVLIDHVNKQYHKLNTNHERNPIDATSASSPKIDDCNDSDDHSSKSFPASHPSSASTVPVSMATSTPVTKYNKDTTSENREHFADVEVLFRQPRGDELESGMPLLACRESGSSQGSLTENELRTRIKLNEHKKDGQESYV